MRHNTFRHDRKTSKRRFECGARLDWLEDRSMLTPTFEIPYGGHVVVNADNQVTVHTLAGSGDKLTLQGWGMEPDCKVWVNGDTQANGGTAWAVVNPPYIVPGSDLQTLVVTVPSTLKASGLNPGLLNQVKIVQGSGPLMSESPAIHLELLRTDPVVTTIQAAPGDILLADGHQRTMIIKGDQFVSGDTTVTINGPATPQFTYKVVDKNTISVDYTATVAGHYGVFVRSTGPFLPPGMIDVALLAPTPVINSLSDDSIFADGSTTTPISIVGQNFQPGSAVYLTDSANVDAAHTQKLKPSSVSPEGTLLVFVVTPKDLTKIASNGAYVTVATPQPAGLPPAVSNQVPITIHFVKPVLTALETLDTPAQGTQSIDLKLDGSGFAPKSTVTVGGTTLTPIAASPSVPTQISVNVPAALLAVVGSLPVTVDTPSPAGDLVSNSLTLTVSDPKQNAITLSPTSLDVNQSNPQLTVSGSGFNRGAVIKWNGQELTTSYYSSNYLQTTIPADDLATAGTAAITVTNANPDGTPGDTTPPATFTIDNPVPSASFASNLVEGHDLVLTLKGVVDGATVVFNGASYPVTQAGAGQGSATIPAADISPPSNSTDTSNKAITFGVSNPAPNAGAGSGELTIQTPVPTLTSLGNADVDSGSPDQTILVTGTNFFDGVSYARWDALPAPYGLDDTSSAWDLAASVLSDTEMQVTIPAADLALGGVHQISVRSRGGGVSNSLPFTVHIPHPAITDLNRTWARQDEVSQGGTQNPPPADIIVTIDGQGFVADPTTGNALTTVQFNGVTHAAHFVSPTQITVGLGYDQFLSHNDLAKTGTFDLTATNPGPGGGVSNAASFTVLAPQPAISLLYPGFTYAGGSGEDVYINGSGFMAGAVVNFGGTPEPTSLISSQQLVFHVPTAALAATGNIEVSVVNVDGQFNSDTSAMTNDPAKFYVRPVPAPTTPTAKADTFQFDPNGAVSGSGATSVLASAKSADGRPQDLRATLVTSTAHGSLTLNADGSFSYTPGASFAGIDSFTYQVSEGSAIGNTATVTLLASQASLVDKLYHQVLGRSAEDQGLTYWTGLIDKGSAPDVVAKGIFNSAERLNPLVTGFYEKFLSRGTDPGGLDYWVKNWQTNGDPDGVVVNILASKEFYDDAGDTHQGFVTLLYQRFLGRAPEPSGISYWTGLLDSGQMNTQQVASAFRKTHEQHVNLVDFLFGEYFNNPNPSPAQAQLYVGELDGGQTQTQVEQAIIDSPEYRSTPPAPAPGKVGGTLYGH